MNVQELALMEPYYDFAFATERESAKVYTT